MPSLKVTLSLPDDVLQGIDRYVASHPGATRSGLTADVLRDWLREQQDAEVAAYYESLSEEERAEDRAWSALASASASRTWR